MIRPRQRRRSLGELWSVAETFNGQLRVDDTCLIVVGLQRLNCRLIGLDSVIMLNVSAAEERHVRGMCVCVDVTGLRFTPIRISTSPLSSKHVFQHIPCKEDMKRNLVSKAHDDLGFLVRVRWAGFKDATSNVGKARPDDLFLPRFLRPFNQRP